MSLTNGFNFPVTIRYNIAVTEKEFSPCQREKLEVIRLDDYSKS